MSQQNLRNWMKYGPLTGLFIRVRRIKRRLRHQPYHHIERFNPSPLAVEILREQVRIYPDNARLYYSLALAYLEPVLAEVETVGGAEESSNSREEVTGVGDLGDAAAERSALACLRCAQTCKGEASERINLYRALAENLVGDVELARRLAESLAPDELTVSESALRARILRDAPDAKSREEAALSPPMKQAAERVRDINPVSLLIVGDAQAMSACWAPDADYLLAAQNITGLSIESVAAVRREFSVCLGSAEDQERARTAGIQCEHRLVIPFSFW